MPKVFEFITAERLKGFLRQYFNAFGGEVFFLGASKDVLVKFPEDAREVELDARPVFLRDSPIGYVAMQKGRSGSLDFIAENLSNVIEMGYEIESLSGEVARNYEELSLLWGISSRLGSGLDVDRICRVLAEEVMNLCPSTNVSVMLAVEIPHGDAGASCLKSPAPSKEPLPAFKKILVPKVSLGKDASRASTMTFSTEGGLLGHVFDTKEALTVCDVSEDSRFEGFPYSVIRILIVPMVSEGAVVGMIAANDKLNGEEYYSPEIKLLTSVASECATSIKKALLYDEIREMLFRTAEAFSFAIDAKDPYTYGHSKRVSRIAEAVAEKLLLPPDTITWIRLAALLHDIGKIGVPEDILHNAGKLVPDAMERMKEHPCIGAKMIENIKRFREVARWICHHHEHYDGS